jgi:protoporphyrinogen oxidase
VLILGGGISGLSCRAALAGSRDTLLLEAEPEIGGLLRVYRRGDFTFDTTVHAVSLQNPQVRQLFEALLPAGWYEFEKENLIWQAGRVIDYPYQFHLSQLPAAVQFECTSTLPEHPGRNLASDCSFEDWLLGQFGRGLYEHFFAPYNTKLYGVHPSELEAAPMVWTIPTHHRAEILAGAAQLESPRRAGPRFLYPRGADGIATLVHALAGCSQAPIRCGERVVAIDPQRRRVETERGLQVHYRELVSTLPLPQLVRICQDATPGLRGLAAMLDVAAITVVEVGIRERRAALEAHWTYFPDPAIPFYRMTRLERISPDLCPPGGSALVLECPGRVAPDRTHVLETLADLGVLGSAGVEWYGTRCIPCAYVLFRPGTTGTVATLGDALQERGIRSVGRYGEWRYANIEQCVLAGLEAAQGLLRRRAAPVPPHPDRPAVQT